MKSLPCTILLLLGASNLHAAVFAHYSFDTDYTDSSGNGRNGTLVEGQGSPSGTPAGATGNSLITSTAGSYKFGGGAMTFSADRDYVSLPQVTFTASSAYTIAFWARVAAPVAGESATAAQFDMVIGDRNDNNNFIALSQGGASRFRGPGSGATQQQDFGLSGTSGGVGNDWRHYALVADGAGGLNIYIDNNLVLTATGKSTAFLYDTIGEAYSVNTTANDFDFDGEIDEVWVFDQAITATTVGNLYNFNSVVPEPSVAVMGGLGMLALLRRNRRS